MRIHDGRVAVGVIPTGRGQSSVDMIGQRLFDVEHLFQSSVVGGLRFLVYFRCVGDLRVECVDLPLVGSDLVCGHRFALHDFLFQRCVVFRRRHRVLICFDLRGERVEFLFVLALFGRQPCFEIREGFTVHFREQVGKSGLYFRAVDVIPDEG